MTRLMIFCRYDPILRDRRDNDNMDILSISISIMAVVLFVAVIYLLLKSAS